MRRKVDDNKKQPWVLIVIVVFVLAMIGIAAFVTVDVVNKKQPIHSRTKATTYQECADAGYPIQMSYPAVCVDGEGNNFIQPE